MKLYYTRTEPFPTKNLRLLSARGYTGVHFPFRQIVPLDVDLNPKAFDYIVVSSKHAARWLRRFPPEVVPPVAAVGRVTTAALDGFRLAFSDDETPANAAELVDRLKARAFEPAKGLFARGAKALDTIPNGLPGIHERVVYRTEKVKTAPAMPALQALLYFQSPSAVDDYLAHFDRTPHYLAAIGPSTAAAIQARGLVVDFQPSRPETAVFLKELPASRYFYDMSGGQPVPMKETS